MIGLGSFVVPHGNVPRAGETGEVVALVQHSRSCCGMAWADVRFPAPHGLHGSHIERIGVAWLSEVEPR